MDVYVTGEPAGTWETVTGNTETTYHEVDVTGIEDLDALEQYFNETGVIPYEMVNGKKVYVTFAKLPQSNTAVSASAINDLISIAGGSILAGYNTSGTIAKLSKSLVLNAIMRAMYLVIQGNTVEQSIISQLENALNPFCLTGSDDIPVYVDSNGVAYVLADAVEAVRNELITLGAYSDGEQGASINPSIASSALFGNYSKFDLPLPYYSGTNMVIGWLTYASSSSDPVAQYTEVQSDVPMCPALYYEGGSYWSRFYFKTQPALLQSRTCSVYSSGTVTYGSWGNRTASSFTTKDGQTGYQWYGGVRGRDKAGIMTFTNTYDLGGVAPFVDYNDSFYSNEYRDIGRILLYGDITGGATIAGMQAAEGIIAGFGDIALPLPDVWPDWYAKKKQVATPGDDDIYLRSPALPLDVPVDNVFDDGYAGDSDAVTEGDLEDILKRGIVDAIPDILADIIADTAVTADDLFKIPVKDWGDSPTPLPPVLDGSANGLWGIYNPTIGEVNSFGSWLWSSNILDQITRMFASPIDAVIAFHVIYCTPSVGGRENIMCGFLDSKISALTIDNQYVDIDCGTIPITEYYGTALDYDYTKISLYLPFIGFVNLASNVCMGSNLTVRYRVDVLTGTCLAQVSVVKPNTNAVMYTFAGNCAVQLPLTATTYTGTIGALMGLTSSFVGAEVGSMSMFTRGIAQIGQSVGEALGTGGVRQSGAIGSNAGALGPRKPYLIVTRPIAYDAVSYNTQYGYPLNKTVTLGSLSGYTKVKDIHLSGIPCTDDELELIERLLKEGVIIN